MNKFNSILAVLVTLFIFQCLESHAQYVVREGDEDAEVRRKIIVLPYAFSSEVLGFGIGIGGSYAPESQPQTTYFGTLYFTDNGSWLGMLGGYNMQFPNADRFTFRPYVIANRHSQKRLYLDVAGIPNIPGERAGSNESSEENYVERDAYEITFDLPMRYTLPMGHFREKGIHTYVTRNGILRENPSGATSLNPLESGQSVLQFRPYYRKMWDDSEEGETLYFELAAEHDNRDFIPNPHRGYKIKLAYRYDPNWVQDANEWAAWEGELDTFIPLPETSWARQQTIALAAWSSYSPTYDVDTGSGKPPYFAGPNLGGYYRLRGYPSYRFHDKAAIHYTAEYRVMPEWQPLGDIAVLDPLMIRWWQLVTFAEIGRVAPSWNFGTLHEDMKSDIGIGVRGMFNSGIGRIDLVVSDEGVTFVAMFGHSF